MFVWSFVCLMILRLLECLGNYLSHLGKRPHPILLMICLFGFSVYLFPCDERQTLGEYVLLLHQMPLCICYLRLRFMLKE